MLLCVTFAYVDGAAVKRLSEKEGNYRLIPSSTVLAWTVVVEHAGADCLYGFLFQMLLTFA